MFPCVSDVRVEVNHHHEPVLVVKNTETANIVSIAFVCSAAAERVRRGNLHQCFNMKEASEKRMRHRDVFWFAFREDFLQLPVKSFPLVRAVEIVNEDEPTAQKILS